MKVSKLFTVISSTVLFVAFGHVFAAEPTTTCPNITDVRQTGSVFNFAKLQEGWDWELISQPFDYNDQQWQTAFTITLAGQMEPKEAIKMGSEIFKSTPFAALPTQAKFGNKTICSYTGKGSPYTLTVSTPVEYGIS